MRERAIRPLSRFRTLLLLLLVVLADLSLRLLRIFLLLVLPM
nr:MAG TPA: hypothetical protein [Caudoviricetes sp.]